MNCIIFGMTVGLLVRSIKLSMQINELRKEVDNLNNNRHSENEEVRAGFKYVGLDLNEHLMEELQITGHPRYLYYTSNGRPTNDSRRENPYNNVLNFKVNNNDNINNDRRNNSHNRTIEELMNENNTLRETNRKLNNELSILRERINGFINAVQ